MPDISNIERELDRLREQVAVYEAAAVAPMLFDPPREPTTNERHLSCLLSWRNAEAKQLQNEARTYRKLLDAAHEDVVGWVEAHRVAMARGEEALERAVSAEIDAERYRQALEEIAAIDHPDAERIARKALEEMQP